MLWKKTSCVLCGNWCALEVQVENNAIENDPAIIPMFVSDIPSPLAKIEI